LQRRLAMWLKSNGFWNCSAATMIVACGRSASRTPSSNTALELLVGRSATTRSAFSSHSYMGRPMVPECWISSARMHSSPAASNASLMIAQLASRSSTRPSR
jgi:hypothetical protein